MSVYLPEALRNRLEAVDDHRCAYCRTSQANTGQPMTVDHILPVSQGGATTYDNLCFACRQCNEWKGHRTTARDPLTGEMVPLFHPRQHVWTAHFTWDDAGIFLLGVTAIGRATIVALNINAPVLVAVRRRWVSVGWHPPKE
ncbi:MAG: HNH endonuclease [Syntrophaceae bacterium]|nr:HNH endonuclease [Syntrophaceae bacterium]